MITALFFGSIVACGPGFLTLKTITVRGKLLLAIAFLSPMPCLAQNRADRKIIHEIGIQIPQLSADRNGSGSSQYLGYLEQQFRAAGLAPATGRGYRQQVVYEEGKRYFPGTRLFINGQKLQPGKDFMPLPFSGQGTAQGEPLVAV